MTAAGDEAFVITRLFDAPRALVWRVWTEADHLIRWWGPKGFERVSCTIDLRPGGLFHYGLKAPDGTAMWGRFVFREIVAPERLVFIVSFADARANVVRHPWSQSWPLETLSVVTFEDECGKTRITVRWTPHEASALERKTFFDGRDSMSQGWTGTFDELAGYLAAR
jgi:uncharacterized protein YndB with AHSA1/START domain